MSAYGSVAEDLAVARAKRARFPGSPPTEPRAPEGISNWDGVGVNVAVRLQPRKTLGE